MRPISAALFALAIACGGGDGGDGDGDGDGDGGGGEVELADRIGCHMTPQAIPKGDDGLGVCIKFDFGNCFAGNGNALDCSDTTNEAPIIFEWEPGEYYNVKMFGWTPESSTHGEVVADPNLINAILDLPTSTEILAIMRNESDGSALEVTFEMGDEYVYFGSIIQRLSAR